ncbi:MAG TPA: DUF1080 domain-containing protein [Tepidisphaeraceae bacterium]|nr:DUF1080 domain-containing protein [Tepidisphaeraceae bacterium]
MRRLIPFASVVLLVALAVWADDKQSAAPDEEEFVMLFNGKDLSGWIYGTMKGKEHKQGAGYQVDPERGVLYTTETDGGNLYTEKQYANFVFRFEFKLTPGANNGVALRGPREGNAAYLGMESQILDDTAEKYAKLRPAQYHGSIYDLFPSKRGHLKPVGDWNEEEITVNGRHVTVKLNGATIVEANLDDVKDEAVLKRHPGLKRTGGHLGFLGHGAAVEFRNLRIKELPSTK